MTAVILDGKRAQAARLSLVKEELLNFKKQYHRMPGLAVILVGTDAASQIYVKNKRLMCANLGIESYPYDLSASTSEQNLLAFIETLNQASHIDGILVQLPLPSHINEQAIIEAISPLKDVDGFHPYNTGRLSQGQSCLMPCTPLGILNLLDFYELSVVGKHAVVIGASNIVGRPLALALSRAGATVTVCHSKTPDLAPHVKVADILVVATGVKDLIDVDWVKSSTVVIDVGIHRQTDGKLRGDINFKSFEDKVAYITPVPGGVGPMTIVSLIENTLKAAKMIK